MITKFKLMLLLMSFLASTSEPEQPVGELYSVWAEPGFHLIMNDNGTPDDYDDDWVVDWEDNRVVSVYVFD